MKRWLVAALLIALAALVLWPIASHPGAPEDPAAPRDVLGYSLDPARPLEVEVPAGIEALYVTTWAVLDDPACEPLSRYAYGLVASFFDEKGAAVGVRDFDLVSRRACDGEPNTRLADAPDPVADHRTIVLRTADLLPRGGRLRLLARLGLTRAVIAMIEARYRRDPYGQQAREIAFTREDRRRIAGQITSLGFADLPPTARAEIAGAWSRRVDASGIDGRDYFLRRLTIRDFTTPLPAAEAPPAGFAIGARHFAAFNIDGALEIELAAPEGTRLRLRDPRAASTPISPLITLGPEGTRRVKLAAGPLRTVVLEGDGPDVYVQTIVDTTAQSLQQIGDVRRRPVPAGRVALTPDLRLVKFASLDPLRPVVAHIADGSVLRIELRGALAEDDPAEQLAIPIQMTWGSAPDQRLEQEITLRRSRFERWGDGTDATDRARLLIRPPITEGAVLVTGAPSGRVVVKAFDPRVQDLLEPPYRVDLQPDEIWRYPPFDLRQWVPVLPENHEELREEGRWIELREQVRIEKPGVAADSVARPERILVPEGNPVRRRFFTPAWLAAGEAMPGDAWTALSATPRRVLVASEGPAAGRARLLFRTSAAALGGTWSLRAEGAVARSDNLSLTSGTVDVPLSAGPHLLALEGPSDSLFFVDAPPEGGGEIVRERTVFELTKGAPIQLHFSQRADQPLTVVLFVVTEGAAAPWSLRYAIDRGKPAALVGRFFRALTVPGGALSGDGAGMPRGWLWESAGGAAAARDPVTKVRIPIGDDLLAGRRTVRLELGEASAPLWIAAVLFGQAPDEVPAAASMWVEVAE